MPAPALSTPHVFMLKFMKDHQLDEDAVATYVGYKPGTKAFHSAFLPTRDAAERIKSYLNSVEPNAGNDYEILVIRARLASYHAQNNNLLRHRILAELPTTYWHAALDQIHHPNHLPKHPDWTEQLIPIRSAEDYLHAVRCYLHLPVESVASMLNCNEEPIRAVERATHNANSEVGIQLAALYNNIQERMLKIETHQPRFFDAAKFTELLGRRALDERHR